MPSFDFQRVPDFYNIYIYIYIYTAFLCKKAAFYKLAACKNTAFLCKKAAFLQVTWS